MVNERVNGCFGELNGITVLIEQFNLGFELVGIAKFVEKIKFNQDLKLAGIDRGFMLDILQEADKISVSVIPQSIKFTANALVEVFDGSHAFIDGTIGNVRGVLVQRVAEADRHDFDAALCRQSCAGKDFLLVIRGVEQGGNEFNRVVITIVGAVIGKDGGASSMIQQSVISRAFYPKILTLNAQGQHIFSSQ